MALELLKTINHEIQWITAKWLFSDVFRIVDAEASNWLRYLEAQGHIKHDKGYVEAK